MPEPIYRIPPYVVDEDLLSKSDLTDIVDWGLSTNVIPDQWVKTRGSGILIGIIDTGKPNHVDLPTPAFAYNMSNSPVIDDRQGHATHVAGIAGARANNKGAVGVAPDVSIGYIKGLGDDGSGTEANLARAVRQCVKEGCHIINMSWGGNFSRLIDDAVTEAEAAGVLCIVAAGNDGYSGEDTINHPASSQAAIAITSYNQKGEISDFSSGGEGVDLAFPGERILSTWLNNKYTRLSGTSMATPFAVGVAALALASYKARNIEWSPKLRVVQMLDIIKSTAQDKGPTGWDNRWGWGIVDVGRLVDWTPTPIPVPTPGPMPMPVKVGPYTINYQNDTLTIVR